jgi:hypothetical protein
VKKIVIDVLLPLPNFTTGSARARELNNVLVKRLNSLVDYKTHFIDSSTAMLMDVAVDVVAIRKLADPTGLFRFADRLWKFLEHNGQYPEARSAALAAVTHILATCDGSPYAPEDLKQKGRSATEGQDAAQFMQVSSYRRWCSAHVSDGLQKSAFRGSLTLVTAFGDQV